MNSRVIVFDDPVTSMDSEVLFIVSSLIKVVLQSIKDNKSTVKQVFILTHNVYFHKEVTFSKKPAESKGVISYWLIRKVDGISRVYPHDTNPVKTSYALLWREYKESTYNHHLSIQNVMRRIIETYFKIFGGIDPFDLTKGFEGDEKQICNSLLSWVNDGSHFVSDDLYVDTGPETVAKYKDVFRRIFFNNSHGAHYDMMMATAN